MTPGRIHIGTSGWHYAHWRGRYYPQDLPAQRWLSHYLRDFDSAEINGSFYRMPSDSTLAAWRDAVPRDFRFALKASRFITHAKKLMLPLDLYDRFFDGIATLQPKLGPVLFQTPPHWRVNPDRLAAFLKALPRRYRYAFEFREPTWLVPEIYKLLSDHGAAICLYHIAGFESPIEVTTDFVYIRLHGPGAKYQGTYADAALRTWARRIRRWSRDGKTVWCYFDNDQNAYAARDALRLKRLVAGGRARAVTARARPTRPRSIR